MQNEKKRARRRAHHSPEIVKRVAGEAKLHGRLDDGLRPTEQEYRTARTLPGTELLAGQHQGAILAVPDEDAGGKTPVINR